jgi:thiol-disulfide isomerase/thioredoxin
MNLQSRRWWLFGGAAAAAAGAGVGLGWWRAATQDSPARPPNLPAPADLWGQSFERPDGAQLVMTHLRGKPLLLNFWATWCAPCVAEMPMLDTFQREHAGWNVVGLAVDNPEPVRDFVVKRKVEFAIGLVGFAGSDLARELGNSAGALPFSVIFDRNGAVKDKKLGALKPEDLSRWAKTIT